MIKRYDFSSIREDGEPLVIPVGVDLSKHAYTVLPELMEYLGGLPEPAANMVRTVITALSAFEGFGPNRNGDAWLEEHLLRDNTYSKDGREIVAPMYKSFEHFARPYKHHINRPDSPAYGNVLKSFYNPGMRRVELVVEWDREKAPDICDRLVNYEPVKTSIGFRCTPVDVCSVCGNPAKSRREYCSHLKQEMLQVKPDGRIVCAINPTGMFFDISMVDDPADRTSHAVEVGRIMSSDSPKYTVNDEPVKVAHYAAAYDGWMSQQFSAIADMAIKLAAVEPPAAENTVLHTGFKAPVRVSQDKVSDIVKRVQAQVEMSPKEVAHAAAAMRAIRAPAMPKETLRKMAGYPLKEVLATAAVLGVDVYPEEAQYIGLYEHAPKLADVLFDRRLVVSAGEGESWEITEQPFNDKVAEVLSDDGVLEMRSMWQPMRLEQLSKQAFFGMNPYAPPMPVSSEQVQQHVVGKQALTTAQKMGLIASLIVGAHLTLGDNPVIRLPGSPTVKALAIVGLAGLSGFFTGRGEGREMTRMPIMDRRLQLMQQQQSPTGVNQLLSSPLAYNMLFGKTAGVLTSALQKDEAVLKMAADRLSAAKPYLRTETRIKLGTLNAAEMSTWYSEPMLDAMVLNQAAGSL